MLAWGRTVNASDEWIIFECLLAFLRRDGRRRLGRSKRFALANCQAHASGI